jgi:hypothetical protein
MQKELGQLAAEKFFDHFFCPTLTFLSVQCLQNGDYVFHQELGLRRSTGENIIARSLAISSEELEYSKFAAEPVSGSSYKKGVCREEFWRKLLIP